MENSAFHQDSLTMFGNNRKLNEDYQVEVEQKFLKNFNTRLSNDNSFRWDERHHCWR